MRKPYVFEHEGDAYTLEESVEIVASYELPLCLKEQIDDENAQLKMCC